MQIEAKYQAEKTEREKEIYRLKNVDLKKALDDLKSMQGQLIHAEKMASLGQLTAGIAHEIKNPLNFVNNFAEVSTELTVEILDDLLKDESLTESEKLKEVATIVSDINNNTTKIVQHGKRADSIVKSMMLHARSQSGEKQQTDLNKLVEENLNLAYHGYQAKHQKFQVKIETDFDEDISEVSIIPHDFGRVIINLVNNAFDAMRSYAIIDIEQQLTASLQITTTMENQQIQISVRDNGPGIPKDILDKIFDPFFTTKPTGEGTGLGLSLSYDIISKGHCGELNVETKVGEFTEFVIKLAL
jgi:signal transduction histidine kinase